MKPHKCVPWRGCGGKIGYCIYCGKRQKMKIEVGKKYRMRNYPAPYEYVKIVGSKNDYEDKVFFGNIVVKNFLGLETRSHFCEWGSTGNWDNGNGIDCNDLISEVRDVN